MAANRGHAGSRRRDVLRRAATGAYLALSAGVTAASAEAADKHARHEKREEAEVTPGEDLMQEHGVLERILLIYDEAARRIEQSERFDLVVVSSAANIMRRFVEEYHEKLEEQFVFPRLEAARREADLVAVLRKQHLAGRTATQAVLRLASARTATPELAKTLRAFERMYRPHAAREDTVLFPAFRAVIGRGAYRELGETFEEQEHARFGEHGFEKTVAEIAQLEATLGIADLAKFTPA
jgi:hemerythrin-like domain-containing protein